MCISSANVQRILCRHSFFSCTYLAANCKQQRKQDLLQRLYGDYIICMVECKYNINIVSALKYRYKVRRDEKQTSTAHPSCMSLRARYSVYVLPGASIAHNRCIQSQGSSMNYILYLIEQRLQKQTYCGFHPKKALYTCNCSLSNPRGKNLSR